MTTEEQELYAHLKASCKIWTHHLRRAKKDNLHRELILNNLRRLKRWRYELRVGKRRKWST